MEPFSYQQHYSFLVDSAYDPNTSIELPLISQQVGELTHASSGFPYYHSGATPEISATEVKTYESSSSPPAYESHMDYPSSQVGEEIPTSQVSMEKKRKNSNGTSLSSGQSKDTRESKNRKQRKPSGGLKATEQKKHKADELKASKACEEPPSGYIHVRARRGQATDSHSLAERLRREKISERMKMLQGLVPGCDKVTGKALVLDEIINYVQSLQNQVEFLSMKLASLDPILYDFGEDYDDCMIQRETIPSVIQAAAFENAASSYPLDSSASFLLHGQGPRTLAQDNESFQVQVGDHRQVFLNQAEFSNMCSFQ